MKNNKGFSLIELIVVIAIMAVLIGVIAPQFLGYSDKTKESVLKYNTRGVMQIVSVHTVDYSRSSWYGDWDDDGDGTLNNFLEQKLEVINSGQEVNKYTNNSNIVNPYSGKLSILDYDRTLSSGDGHCPAVFLTANNNYSYGGSGGTSNLIGTIVVYFKVVDGETEEIEFYYIKEDGSKSDYLEKL